MPCLLAALLLAGQTAQVTPSPAATIQKYCVTCHNDRLRTGGLSLVSVDLTKPSANAEVWEKVIRKLRTGAMPPSTAPRPDTAAANALATYLETAIDRDALGVLRAGDQHVAKPIATDAYRKIEGALTEGFVNVDHPGIASVQRNSITAESSPGTNTTSRLTSRNPSRVPSNT